MWCPTGQTEINEMFPQLVKVYSCSSSQCSHMNTKLMKLKKFTSIYLQENILMPVSCAVLRVLTPFFYSKAGEALE